MIMIDFLLYVDEKPLNNVKLFSYYDYYLSSSESKKVKKGNIQVF